MHTITNAPIETPMAIDVRTYDLPELGSVHGVTCDRQGRIWFAHGEGDLVCLDPDSGRILMRFSGLDAQAGTAFDGSHIWQITSRNIVRVDIETGQVVQTIDRPDGVHCSGMAYSNNTLWIGDYRNRRLVQLDIASGAVLRTLTSDRFVTGVEWIDDELWHGAWLTDSKAGGGSSLRRIDPESGEVREELVMPGDWSVSGTGADAQGRIWCGGSARGGLKAVRRP